MARKGRKDRGLFCKRNAAGLLVWYVRLCHEGKERQFGSFKTKTEAREFYEKVKHEQKLGQFFPERYQKAGFATFEQVLNDYLAGFMGKSIRDERRYARMWQSIFPGARLNAITAPAIEKARAALRVGRAPQTVNHYTSFLHRVLSRAIRDKKLPSNPLTEIKKLKVHAGKTRFLSTEEEQTLCDGLGARYAPWVRLAVLTGMRQMEQFSLRWEYVDLNRGLLTLPTTKAGGVQYVYLNLEAVTILRELDNQAVKAHAVIEAQAIARNEPPLSRSAWVFPSENPATHVGPRNFYKRVYLPTVDAMGLEGVTWHTLRHTFASRLAMSGTGEVSLAGLLRHSGTSLVKRYAHLSHSHLKAEVEKASAFGKGDSRRPQNEEAGQTMPATAGLARVHSVGEHTVEVNFQP
jgi:integrase